MSNRYWVSESQLASILTYAKQERAKDVTRIVNSVLDEQFIGDTIELDKILKKLSSRIVKEEQKILHLKGKNKHKNENENENEKRKRNK